MRSGLKRIKVYGLHIGFKSDKTAVGRERPRDQVAKSWLTRYTTEVKASAGPLGC